MFLHPIFPVEQISAVFYLPKIYQLAPDLSTEKEVSPGEEIVSGMSKKTGDWHIANPLVV